MPGSYSWTLDTTVDADGGLSASAVTSITAFGDGFAIGFNGRFDGTTYAATSVYDGSLQPVSAPHPLLGYNSTSTTTSTFRSLSAKVVELGAGGGLAAAYTDWTGPPGAQYGSAIPRYGVLDATGSAEVANEAIDSPASLYGYSYSGIVALADGGFAVLWQEDIRTPTPNYYYDPTVLYGQRYRADGTPESAPVELWREREDSDTYTTQWTTYGEFSAVRLGNGYAVAFEEDRTAQNPAGRDDGDVYVQVAGGARVLASAESSGAQTQVETASLADGGFVVAWQHVPVWINGLPTHEQPDYSIRAQRFDAAGAKVGGEFVIVSAPRSAPAVTSPGLLGLADGGFAVSWAQDGGRSVQVFTAEGLKRGGVVGLGYVTGDMAQLDDGRIAIPVSSGSSADVLIYSLSVVNAAPTAAPDLGYVSRGATALLPTLGLLLNDTDPDGDPLNVTAVGAASAGSAVALSPTPGQIAFTASAATGLATASFEYTASDGGLSATGAVTVNLVTTTNAADTILVNTAVGQASWIDGKGGHDDLIGGAGTDVLFGGAGNDDLRGLGGADTLYGGAGTDWLWGDGSGAPEIDSLYGGAGSDHYVIDHAGDIVSEVSSGGADEGGTDTIYAFTNVTLSAFVENLYLQTPTSGPSDFDGTGNALGNRMFGNDSANELHGLAGRDSLTGGAGNDTLRGGADNDTLVGGIGDDDMDGGEGDDSYTVNHTATGGDTVFDSGVGGVDRVTTNGSFSLRMGDGIERLTSTWPGNAQGTGVATLIGNELDNTLTGGAGKNVLSGLAGRDGLYGNDGDDTLTGGAGRDNLTGGAGNDTFAFTTGDSLFAGLQYDLVNDFEVGTDRIDLDIVAGSIPGGGYREYTIDATSIVTLYSVAKSGMGGTGASVVFVAGRNDGWLFWDTNADRTPDEALCLLGRNSVDLFGPGDLI